MKREIEDGLLSYLRNAQAQRRRNVVLNWKRAPPRPDDWFASHGRHSLWILPQDKLGDSEAVYELRYCWEGGGDRRLATGSMQDLKVHAHEVLSRGGPYGGPSFSSPLSCRWPAFRFETVHSWSLAEVACYGAGWQMWARPLSKTHCCLVQVSPTGSFRVIGCGTFTNMALIAQREAPLLGAIEDDVPIAHEPFQVRVSGKPMRLLHSTGGPVVGWATTALGDVFLVLLGEDDAALVLLTESDEGVEGGDLRVLRRGPPFGINDLEISPGVVTQAR